MAITDVLYNAIFKRTSTMMLFMVTGAYFLDTAIDISSKAIFNSINQGKLWKDIKDNYKPKEPEPAPASSSTC